MTITQSFPAQRLGQYYLTEGGFETEIMYKYGFDLPYFATFPLLNDKNAAAAIRQIYGEVFEVARDYSLVPLLGSFDYRASSDWGTLLGYSRESLADAVHAGITFLREMAIEYAADVPITLVAGYIGPRGDAYQLRRTMIAGEAEDYHSPQLMTLASVGADLAWAMTFNNVEEAIGVARAARAAGIPLAIAFTLDRTARLASGHGIAEAIEMVDDAAQGGPDFYAINCSHPVEFEPALQDEPWMNRVRSIRPNASKMEKIALCKLGHLEEGDPVELGRQMGEVTRRYPHMDILGGCCGTCATHLREIAKNVARAPFSELLRSIDGEPDASRPHHEGDYDFNGRISRH